MSHIDSYQHEYLGQFGYLPIYRFLEKVEAPWGDHDFGGGPENLVLGGGSGEHPGLVLHELEHFVFYFLYEQLKEEEQQTLKDQRYADLKPYFYAQRTRLLEFCQWSVINYVDFDEMARSERMPTPCTEEESIEDWIMASFGELIYYSLTEMNPKQQELKELFAPFDIMPTMQNITLSPPGYPKYRGYRIVDGKSEIGIHRWT